MREMFEIQIFPSISISTKLENAKEKKRHIVD